MIKTIVTETIEKYDEDGNLIEKTTRTETSEDDETRYPVTPASPNPNITPWWQQPWCTTTCTYNELKG